MVVWRGVLPAAAQRLQVGGGGGEERVRERRRRQRRAGAKGAPRARAPRRGPRRALRLCGTHAHTDTAATDRLPTRRRLNCVQ